MCVSSFGEGKKFLSYDTLTFRCRITKINVAILRMNVCYARTRLYVHRRSFIWIIRPFHSRRVGDRVLYHLVVTKFPSLLLTLTLTESDGAEKVDVARPHVRFKIIYLS
ncbi:hypothetical protein TNIN_461051 [Trichonephila inaurata madagascariensis]|uniref:Uncharacterized protein n=1 Tax=Trichonephila inaurata madagascariensis TaxID=2747483 RepID=A0A8X6K2G9_9ARAC|nr:hypothetical protein TNIN_461051 [Trichonephila inaurata madagascariensis]